MWDKLEQELWGVGLKTLQLFIRVYASCSIVTSLLDRYVLDDISFLGIICLGVFFPFESLGCLVKHLKKFFTLVSLLKVIEDMCALVHIKVFDAPDFPLMTLRLGLSQWCGCYDPP